MILSGLKQIFKLAMRAMHAVLFILKRYGNGCMGPFLKLYKWSFSVLHMIPHFYFAVAKII